jgi:hypothetical protein
VNETNDFATQWVAKVRAEYDRAMDGPDQLIARHNERVKAMDDEFDKHIEKMGTVAKTGARYFLAAVAVISTASLLAIGAVAAAVVYCVKG